MLQTYDAIETNPVVGPGGGVALFIRETIDFKHRTDLQSGSIEILCIEVKTKFSKPFLVLAWYRPPIYEHETLNELEILLKTIENENNEIILIGDLNCNNLNTEDRNKVIDHFQGLYRQFQMKQLIKVSTRSTLTSQILTDHFSSNRPSHINDSVFTISFSDLKYGIRKISPRINREPKIIKSRQLKNYDPERFKEELQTVDWESIL